MVGWYVDWLWFGEVGQRGVFWRILEAEAQLALLFGIGVAALFYLNLELARRASPQLTRRLRESPLQVRLEQLARGGLRWGVLAVSLVAGLAGAPEATTHWEEFLKFRHPQPFGLQDPVFHRDIGFYVFTLPFWKYLYGWAFIVVGLATVLTALVYFATQAVHIAQGAARVAVRVRVHLSLLLGVLALIVAWGYRI